MAYFGTGIHGMPFAGSPAIPPGHGVVCGFGCGGSGVLDGSNGVASGGAGVAVGGSGVGVGSTSSVVEIVQSVFR